MYCAINPILEKSLIILRINKLKKSCRFYASFSTSYCGNGYHIGVTLHTINMSGLRPNVFLKGKSIKKIIILVSRLISIKNEIETEST